MTNFARPRYAVMADCGVGEFLWVAYGVADGLAGRNVFSMMERPEDQDLMSEGLFQKFLDWAGEYMAGQPPDGSLPWDIDWQQFNQRGIELAKMLKDELGSSADVRYLRPDNDPNQDSVLLELYENDG